VGRQAPGLVLTVYNWARPRDLSHYETFEHYHATFYQHVEALSLTPFAARAIDRGLTAVLVALVRLARQKYNPNGAASNLDGGDPLVKAAIEAIVQRAAAVSGEQAVADEVRARLKSRVDRWLAEAARVAGGTKLGYREKK